MTFACANLPRRAYGRSLGASSLPLPHTFLIYHSTMSFLRKLVDFFLTDRPVVQKDVSAERGFHKTMPLESILTPSPISPVDTGDGSDLVEALSGDDSGGGGETTTAPATEEATSPLDDSIEEEVESSEVSEEGSEEVAEDTETSATEAISDEGSSSDDDELSEEI